MKISFSTRRNINLIRMASRALKNNLVQVLYELCTDNFGEGLLSIDKELFCFHCGHVGMSVVNNENTAIILKNYLSIGMNGQYDR